MKKTLLASAFMLAIVGCQQSDNDKEQTAQADLKLETEEAKIAYSLGANTGDFLKSNLQEIDKLGIKLDADLIARGVKDALTGEAKLSQEEIRASLTSLNEKAMAKAQEERDKAGAENKAKGEAFLKENAAKEGVQTTESGLQYKVEQQGEGATPAKDDTVVVHYEGRLIDGTVFDSSVQRGQPAEFGVSQVIPGWTEALTMMKEGAKWQLFIPSELAYGERDGGRIPANSVLIFDVELLEVKPAEAEAETESDQESAAEQ